MWHVNTASNYWTVPRQHFLKSVVYKGRDRETDIGKWFQTNAQRDRTKRNVETTWKTTDRSRYQSEELAIDKNQFATDVKCLFVEYLIIVPNACSCLSKCLVFGMYEVYRVVWAFFTSVEKAYRAKVNWAHTTPLRNYTFRVAGRFVVFRPNIACILEKIMWRIGEFASVVRYVLSRNLKELLSTLGGF